MSPVEKIWNTKNINKNLKNWKHSNTKGYFTLYWWFGDFLFFLKSGQQKNWSSGENTEISSDSQLCLFVQLTRAWLTSLLGWKVFVFCHMPWCLSSTSIQRAIFRSKICRMGSFLRQTMWEMFAYRCKQAVVCKLVDSANQMSWKLHTSVTLNSWVKVLVGDIYLYLHSIEILFYVSLLKGCGQHKLCSRIKLGAVYSCSSECQTFTVI